MSGGGGVRQRHSQDYPSSDEDSEDDACSKPTSLSPIEQPTTWTRVQDMLWVGSTIFILYLGDFRSNLIHVLLFDGRIKRVPFYLGVACLFLNAGVVVCTGFPLGFRKKSCVKLELPPSAPLVALLGLLSFSLISFALWPIWSFLSIPLLMTLLVTYVVVWTYLPKWPLKPPPGERILPI